MVASGEDVRPPANAARLRLTTRIETLGEGDADVPRIVPTEGLHSPAPGEVTIRVEAAGVSFAEVWMVRGSDFSQPTFPLVPGHDLVATVTALTETGA